MCKAPKAPKVTVEKPEFLTNPFLDQGRNEAASVNSLRTGRSALHIPLLSGLGIGFNTRGTSAGASGTAGPRGNGRIGGRSTGGAFGGGQVGGTARRGLPAPGSGGGGGGGGRDINVNLVQR